MTSAATNLAKPVVSHKRHRDLLDSYRRHLNAEGKADQTRDNYLSAARDFLLFGEGEGLPELEHLRREHVEMWIESLRETYAPASVVNRYNGLRIFMSWLEEEGEVKANPMARMKRPIAPEVQKDIVTPEQMASVLASLEKKSRWRDLAIVAVLYDTGARASEVANAKTEHVDLDTGTLFFPETKGRRPRTVHLSAKTVRYIDRYHRRTTRPDPDYLFNGKRGQMTRWALYRAVRDVFEEHGLSATIGAHDLRHTSASHSVGHMSESAMMTLYGWADSDMPRHYAKQALQAAAFEEHKRASPMDRLPKR